MTLNELKTRIDRLCSIHGKRADDITVGIVVDKPHVGSRPTTGIRDIYVGIDWDRNKLLIVPEKIESEQRDETT